MIVWFTLKMKLAGCSFFCCCFAPFFYKVILPVAGKPLLSSHVEVFAASHHNVSLPCGHTTPVDLSLVFVEWSRVDPAAVVTILRNGVELVKEKAAEYVGRTAVMEDGSLTLLGVTWRDNGKYRCFLRREPAKEEEMFVSLIVAEVSGVDMIVRLTSAGELFVDCESGGWRGKPQISLQDARGNVLAAEKHSSVGPDNLYSVRAHVDMAAAEGNGTLICRVEIPGMSLANENKIYITNEFNPQKAGLSCYPLWMLFFFMGLVCVIIFVAVLIMKEKKLRLPLQHLIGRCQAAFYVGRSEPEKREQEQRLVGNHGYTEYGDINAVDTTGASEDTMRANQLLSTGERLTSIEASNRLAERDLEEMLKYKEDIISVGQTLHVHPALIAAIISRQSQAGTKLRLDGYGQSDKNSFGLMQINRNYHAVKGKARSKEHVDQGVTFFIQLIKTMERTKTNWSKEQRLKGALACYIAGEDRVIPLARYEDVDSVTPYGDFANDVVARAQWFAHNGF